MRKKSYTEDITERLAFSQASEEQAATFIGFDADRARTPVLFPDSWWKEGLWICAARTGKTSRALTPITAQRIRRDDCPVFIIDLKGDDVFFHTMRLETQRLGRKFVYFTNVETRSTHLFNPVRQPNLQQLTVPQLAEVLLNAMGLWHGFRYGASYFGFQALSALSDALNFTPEETNNGWSFVPRDEAASHAATFEQLEKAVTEIAAKKKEYSGAPALVMSLRKLGSMLQLNTANGNARANIPQSAIDSAINVPRLVLPDEQGRYAVTYLYLRAGSGIVEASLIAKVFIYALHNALTMLRDAYKAGVLKIPPPVAPLVIDEWQNIADDAVKPMLREGASCGLQFILANQDISQLRESSRDLFENAWENVGSKLIFTARLDELQRLVMNLSGEKAIHHRAWVQHDLRPGIAPQRADEGFDIREIPGQRFERNHVIETSARQGHAFFFPATNQKFAEYDGYPIRVVCPHLFGPKTHQAIEQLPWPAKTHETIVPSEHRDDAGDPFSFIPEYLR